MGGKTTARRWFTRCKFSTGPEMEGSEKSFKEAVKGGELFRGKLTRCKTAKSNLTKSLTSFENCVKDFIESETPTTPQATKKRKAKFVMKGVDKMELKVENLRATMEEFIVYVSGLGDDAFEAPTTPTSIMVGANSDADEREQAMRDKLAEHEQVVRRAEVILSAEIVLTQQVVEKPDDTKFSSFRPFRPWETEGLGGARESGRQPGGVRWCDVCKKFGCRVLDAEAAKLTKKQEKRKKERERKKEKIRQLKEAAKAAQSSNLNLSPNNSSSEMDSPRVFDQRSSRVYPQGIAKKCNYSREEERMMKLGAEMEKNIDMSAVLNAKSGKGKVPSPVLMGQIYKNRGDTVFRTESMLADTGCSYCICGEEIIRDLKVRIFPFKSKMQILDASGNYLKLIGTSILYIRTQVLGMETVKRLEVAVQRGTGEREILLSLQTLINWQLIHPGFPNIKISDYVNNLMENKIQTKVCSAVYSGGVNDTNKIRIQNNVDKLGLKGQNLEC